MEEENKKRSAYMDNLSENLTGVSPQNQTGATGGENTGDVDYYTQLKNESYKAMLSKEVQASVAADQARKYTQNMLNAQGYGSQGLAESTQLGIGNQYRAALNEAQNDYENQLLGINQQQREAQENDFQNAVGNFAYAENQGDMDMYMKLMGYMDENGQFTTKATPDIQNAYNTYKQKFDEAVNSEGLDVSQRQAITIDDLISGKSYAYNDNGELDREVTRLRDEYKQLKAEVEHGGIQKGTYVKLSEGKFSSYIYYAEDGNYYYITPAEYNNAPEDKRKTISNK